MAEHEIDRAIRRRAQAPLSRRGFLWAGTMSASAAFLAACTGGGSTASTEPAASSAPGASTGAAPSAAIASDIEKDLFMYNWATTSTR